MSRRARAAFLLAGSLAVAAGCGLDAMATGPAGSPPAGGDGGPLVTADGETDGDIFVDGSGEPSEGSVVFLPPVDGGTDGPTGLPGFCASQMPYVACWDFDDALPGGDAGFPDMQAGGGTYDIVLDGTNHMLQATLPTASAARNSWVRFPISGFGQLAPRYRLDLKFGVRQSSLAYLVLGALWTTTQTSSHAVGIASYTKGAFLDMVLPDLSAARLTAPAGPAWHTAAITLEGTAGALHGVVVVDGAVTLDDETYSAGTALGTSVDMRLGAYYTDGTRGGATAVFDDIVLRTP